MKDSDGIGYSTGPEAIPERVDFRFELRIGEHFLDHDVYLVVTLTEKRSGRVCSRARFAPVLNTLAPPTAPFVS